MHSAPIQTTPIQTTPIQTTPIQTAPIQTAPIQTASGGAVINILPRRRPCDCTVLLVILSLAATANAEEKYSLKYKFTEGQTIVTRITHLAETETTINGNSQKSSSRTFSHRVWKVKSVAEDGTATIVQSLRSVDMSRKLPEHAEETYNSDTDKEVPRDFEPVANSVGKDLSRIKVSVSGEVIDRKDLVPNGVLPGLGQVVVPLPAKPAAIGDKWHFPTEVHIRLEDGKFKKISTRQEYTLKSVKTGVATIELKTQVLTPINDRRIEVQLVQQITNGSLKFDILAGDLISKMITWDETVVGYRGGKSRFEIVAQYQEERAVDEAPRTSNVQRPNVEVK